MIQVAFSTLFFILASGVVFGFMLANSLGAWALKSSPKLRAALVRRMAEHGTAAPELAPAPLIAGPPVDLGTLRERERTLQERQQWLNCFFSAIQDGKNAVEAEKMADEALSVLKRRAVFEYPPD